MRWVLAVLPWMLGAACSAFADGSATAGPTGGGDRDATGEGGADSSDGGPSDPPTDAGDGGALGGYRAEVLRDAPVAYWRLGEPMGSPALDETKRQLAGTYGAGCRHGQPSLLPSVTDTALGISGTCTVLVPLGFDFSARSRFTIEAWFRALSAATGRKTIFERETVDEATSLHIQNGQLTFQRKTAAATVGPAYPILENVVYHVVATYDGAVSRLYVNGQLRDSKGDTSSQTAMTGTDPVIGDSFDGDVDEVAVYDKDLSEQAITRHFAAANAVQPDL